MDASITHNVTDIVENDKQSLEHLLGAPLDSAQKVHILAYTPGQEPDPECRARAADNIERVVDRGTNYARQQDISDAEIDEAVDEAMQAIRRRNAP